MGPVLLLAAGVTAVMSLTYVPQALVLTLLNGPLGPFSAVLLVLSESATITSYIAKRYMLRRALLDMFDAVLVSRGCESLVRGDREVTAGTSGGQDEVSRLGRLKGRAESAFEPKGIIRSLFHLLLNLIPGVGPVIYVALQGRSYGPVLHARYFELRRVRGAAKDAWVKKNRGGYDALGAVSVLLEMIPVVGALFGFTNVVGASLWAADLEKQRRKETGLGPGGLGEQETGVTTGKDD